VLSFDNSVIILTTCTHISVTVQARVKVVTVKSNCGLTAFTIKFYNNLNKQQLKSSTLVLETLLVFSNTCKNN